MWVRIIDFDGVVRFVDFIVVVVNIFFGIRFVGFVDGVVNCKWVSGSMSVVLSVGWVVWDIGWWLGCGGVGVWFVGIGIVFGCDGGGCGVGFFGGCGWGKFNISSWGVGVFVEFGVGDNFVCVFCF